MSIRATIRASNYSNYLRSISKWIFRNLALCELLVMYYVSTEQVNGMWEDSCSNKHQRQTPITYGSFHSLQGSHGPNTLMSMPTHYSLPHQRDRKTHTAVQIMAMKGLRKKRKDYMLLDSHTVCNGTNIFLFLPSSSSSSSSTTTTTTTTTTATTTTTT